MRTKNIICGLSLLSLVNYAQQQSWQWAKQAGSYFDNSNYNNEAIRDVKTDNQGNAYAVGYFYNFPIFQNGANTTANVLNALSYVGVKETDAYLIKYSPCGSTLWRKKIAGGSGLERAYSLNFDNNGDIIVFGTSGSDPFIAGDGTYDTIISNNTANPIFLAKFDTAGNFIKINTYPNFPVNVTIDAAIKFFINSQGNYFLTNGVSSYVINTAGTVINTYTYTTGTSTYNVPPYISGIKLDKYDNVYLSGSYQNVIIIAQNTTITPTSISLTANSYWPMGIIMKFSPTGNLLWYQTSSAAVGGDMAIDTSANIFVIGGSNMSSNTNVFGYNFNVPTVGFPVLFLNTNTGGLVSALTATGTNGDYCIMRYTDRDNNFYGTGELSSSLKFNNTTYSAASTASLGGGLSYTGQMYFVHFNSSGNFVDLNRVPLQGNQYDNPLGVTKDEQGNVYTWGMFNGVLDSAGTTVYPFGGLEDGFIAKYGFASSNQTATTMSPLSPTSLTAVYQGSLSNYVTWIDNSNYETAYALWQTNTGSSTYSLLAVLPANTTTYMHTGLSYNNNYCYKVKAINNVGSSAFTNVDCAATPAFSLVPYAPLNLTAANNGNLINNLTWTDNSSNETNFELWHTTGSSSTYSLLATLPANTTSYTHANLTYTTTYCYKVAATNSIGTSALSNIACAGTPNPPNLGAVGIAEQETISSYTRVYPNPTPGNVTIQFASMGGESTIEVLNSLGQTLQALNLPAHQNSLLENVPLKLPGTKGIYLIKIKTGVNQVTVERKVVVE